MPFNSEALIPKYEPLVPKLTPKEDLWEEGQALKVLAFGDLRYTDQEAFWKAVAYEPYPGSEVRK
jgi:hypothetical protein